MKFTHSMERQSCLSANPGLFEIVSQVRMPLIISTSQLSHARCSQLEQTHGFKDIRVPPVSRSCWQVYGNIKGKVTN